jgi:hypothetical protein
MGVPAWIVHTASGFVLTWHGFNVPVISLLDNPSFTSNDVFVFPEGSIQFMINSRDWGIPRVVIPLNWSYIYLEMPEGRDWRDYGITHVMTPSPVIKDFVEWAMELPVTLIDDYIDTDRFTYQPPRKINKIAYMPRKSDVGDTLIRILGKRQSPAGTYLVVRLLDLNEDEYATQLIESRIYLAVTSREGANISVLEAMSAGCLVIGFAGVGGNAFMVGEGAQQNCFLVENEDLLTLGKTLERVVAELETHPAAFDSIIRNGIATASRFGDMNREALSLKNYFESL